MRHAARHLAKRERGISATVAVLRCLSLPADLDIGTLQSDRNVPRLDRVGILGRPYVERLLHLGSEDFFIASVAGHDRVIVHFELLAVHLGWVNARPFLDPIAGDDLIGTSEQLQDGQQFAVWGPISFHHIFPDRGLRWLLRD